MFNPTRSYRENIMLLCPEKGKEIRRGFFLGWLEELAKDTKNEDEKWEISSSIYAWSNLAQVASSLPYEGRADMSSEEYDLWVAEMRAYKDAYFNFLVSEVAAGEILGREAYLETKACLHTNKGRALVRIAKAGSLKAAKARAELNKLCPMWEMI